MHNSSLINTSPQRKALIIFTVMCVAILEILDSTIINVALPHMMPALGANQDQITWVLTSYIVASAMMIPLTGFLTRRFGERNILLINTTGFMISSLLCGTATSLSGMVFLRCMQGAFGAALIPLSQSILRQSFPPEKQGKAMAIWGMGILVAPVFGPTLGGLITEYSSWRWVFYINTPICGLALALAWLIIPHTKTQRVKIDVIGILLMFMTIGCLQLFLDQGNLKDWFDSHLILILAITSGIGLVLFISWSLSYHTPAIKIRLFSNRNFRVSTLCLAIFCGTQFSILTLEPILLQESFGYTALTSGLTLMPMGIFSAISVGLCSSLINRVPVKYILLTGVIFSITGSHFLSTLTLHASQSDFVQANAVMGFGMGFFMVPLSVYALSNIPPSQVTDGAGLYSYGRMLGTSVGISLLSTLISRETLINYNHLRSNINPVNPHLQNWLHQHHQSLSNPSSIVSLNHLVVQQASFQAFIDAFYLAGFCFLLMIPLILMLGPIRPHSGAGAEDKNKQPVLH